jgi:hypothetical protein
VDIAFFEGLSHVVAGFPTGVELAPIMVVDNLMRRALTAPDRGGDFEIAVDTWCHSLRGARE